MQFLHSPYWNSAVCCSVMQSVAVDLESLLSGPFHRIEILIQNLSKLKPFRTNPATPEQLQVNKMRWKLFKSKEVRWKVDRNTKTIIVEKKKICLIIRYVRNSSTFLKGRAQRILTHGNTLQYTATHYNTLQHTATSENCSLRLGFLLFQLVLGYLKENQEQGEFFSTEHLLN